jgi:putative aldouronate transport system permease protein
MATSQALLNPLEDRTYKRAQFRKKVKNGRTLLLMCTPALVFFFVFSYLPLPGIYVAFVRYNYFDGMFRSAFVGFENFRFLVISGKLWMLTRNTVLYNLAFIITGNVFAIAVAVMLNEISNKAFRKVSQTILLLPYFISFVIVGVFAYNILNYDYGVLNSFLRRVGLPSVAVYSTPAIWPGLIVFVNLWKGLGYGTIIYFAAITAINPEIYEAAHIDGANAWQRIRRVTLPNLKPTFVILLLFSLGQIMRGNFQLFYNLAGANALLFPLTDIIETFVFRSLIVNFNFSMGTAVSLFQSVFGFLLVITANWSVRRMEPELALF